ncbi:carbon-nitrogen hydrolase [Aspergillus oleicola]
MQKIQKCAATHKIAVSLDYSENHNNSLYLSQSFIGKGGEVKMHRRKIKPTHAERTITATAAIHVTAWPPMNYHSSFPEGSALWSRCHEEAHNLSTTHAIEDNCFVVLTSSFYSQEGIDAMRLGDGKLYHIPGGGCAAITAPDGRKVTKDLSETEEGLLIADCDFAEILKVKAMLDVHGHYSRPDLLWLEVDYREKKQVRSAHD